MSLQVDIGKKLETMTLHTLIDIKHKQLLTYLKKIIITIIFIIFLCKYNLFSRFPPQMISYLMTSKVLNAVKVQRQKQKSKSTRVAVTVALSFFLT